MKKWGYSSKLFYFLVVVFSFSFFLLNFSEVLAANLYFSPTSGSYNVSRTFTVNVFVSSADQAMNAASGVVAFEKEKLEVVSLSKSGSIVSLWVQEPSFSNSGGVVNFEGIVLNPGFTGASGRLLTINFRARTGGNAPLTFISGSVLANDGKGTNILASLGSAEFSIGPAAAESTTPAETAGLPLAPRIISPTHSDRDKWYANPNPKFEWELPRDVTGVDVLADRNPSTNPGTRSDGLLSSYAYTDVDDGVWYFHVRLRNVVGWGDVAHFKFQIDTQKPNRFSAAVEPVSDLTEPKRKLLLTAQDSTSGVDHYTIQINNSNIMEWPDNVFETPVLVPGRYEVIAKAFDKAGNFLADTAGFDIESIKPPTLTEYPEDLNSGDVLKIKGKTYPDSLVTVYFKQEDGRVLSQEIRSNTKGDFTLIWSGRVKRGIYEVWARAADGRGAISSDSAHANLVVRLKTFLRIGELAITYLTTTITLLIFLFVIIFGGLFAWQKFSQFRRRLKKEVREVDSSLHSAFDVLKEDIREQLKLFEQARSERGLTELETRVMRQLKKDLDAAEKVVRKEIADVEREINKPS